MFNPYLVIPVIVWAITQLLKFVLAAAAGRLDFRYLYASGGMPSVHSAVVTSLATTAFLLDGPNSPIFGVTAILAGIVMYDSFGVRRASGEQAAAINVILDSLNEDRIGLSRPQQRLREILGHKPLEVAVGALLGLTLACLFNYQRLGALTSFVTQPIGTRGMLALAAGSAFVVVAAIAARFVYLGKYRRIETARRAVKHSSTAAVSIGLLGLLNAFLVYEKIAIGRWLLWPMLIAVIAAVTVAVLIRVYRAPVPAAIAENAELVDKSKWFEGPNKKRRAAKARAKKRR